MKLDRETEALLHWVYSATATPLWNSHSYAARDEYRRTVAKTEIAPPGNRTGQRSRRVGPCRAHEAAALGLDPERIAIAGDSAGGGLAAVALHETTGQLAAPVRAQTLIYPALDLRGRLPSRKELAHHFPIPRDMIQWFSGITSGLPGRRLTRA